LPIVTVEARAAFLAFFFVVWALLGLLPWVAAALWRRGRGVLLALPLALLAGAAGGVAVPLAGADDARGFLFSLGAALLAGGLATALGVWLEGGLVRRPGE
jgi:hypothetical protein